MQVSGLIRTIAAVMTLGALSACGPSSDHPNHSQYGGLWDQVFSQAMAENPGKAE